jgi:hypothetical protein
MVTMTYSLLRFVHLVGLTLMGAGLIGVWLSDLRSRKVRDLMLMVIVSLGAIRPTTWSQFIIGTACALAVAMALTISIPHLYPWVPPTQNKRN